MDQQQYRVPFEIDVTPRGTNFSALDVAARLYLRGHELSGSAGIDLKQQISTIQFNVADLDFGRFADLIGQIPELTISGKLNIKGRAELQLSPLQVRSLEAECKLSDGNIAYQSLLLQNSRNAKNEKIPFTLNIHGTHGRQWEITGSSLSVLSPLPLRLSELQSTVILTEDAIKSTGAIKAALEPMSGSQVRPLALKILEPFTLLCHFAAEAAGNGKWQFSLSSLPVNKKLRKPGKIQYNNIEIRSQTPTINLSASGDNHHGNAIYAVVIPDARFLSAATTAKVPVATLKGTARYRLSPKEYRGADFTLVFPNTRVAVESTRVKMNNASLSGNIKQSEKGDYLFDGLLRLTGGEALLPQQEVKIAGARVEFPLQWPPRSTGKSGTFSVDDLQYRELILGGVSGKLHQTISGFAFKGIHASKLLPQLRFVFDGKFDLVQSGDYALDLHYSATGRKPETAIDLGKLVPAAGGITINGNFEAKGDLSITESGPSGKIRMNLANAKLQMAEQNIAIEGIQMDMLVPKLPEIRSAPRQIISFTNASIGALSLEGGRIEFQLESARSLFIEKSNFKWCGGNVDVPAIRIVPGADDYNLTLYCDRLNLARVLEQFGVAAAEGSGAVSGKIPLRYQKGQLNFDDGFLFSTPGEGGKILLKGTEVLTAGIPPGTPQYIQMELAREALKDYDYTWAKLNLTTEGETFLLRLQFDGKPAKLLPFVYKKEIGGFVKVEAGAQGSRFQGIRLDVNFRLPLNKLMQYKDIVNMIK
jgi:hypothetical protein